MKTSIQSINHKDINKIIREARNLITLKELFSDEAIGNTAMDYIPILKVKKGNKLIDNITVSIFKLDNRNIYGVYVNSKNKKNNTYLYTKSLSDSDLKETICEILKKFKRRYLHQYRLSIS